MDTLLIPVDLSDTARNAVSYAAALVAHSGCSRVILLKSMYDSLFDAVVIGSELITVNNDYRNDERSEAEAQLAAMGQTLRSANPGLAVDAIVSDRPIVRAARDLIAQEQPSLLLVGSDNVEYDSDSYISSHIVELSKASPVNVLIVPSGQQFRPVRQALIPVDPYIRSSLNLVNRLADVPFLKSAEFGILSLERGRAPAFPDAADSAHNLDDLLQNVRYKLFFSQEQDVLKAISGFLQENATDLLIALPGKYSFLYGLTHRSLSDAVCRNTQRPVLILKDIR